LADEDILSDDLLRQLISVGEVDVLVGLHTHNHAKTIGHVVQVIRDGLLKYFPRERVAILNADGGSNDGTPDLVRAAAINDVRNASSFEALRTMHCISSQYSGDLSNGTAMHVVLAAADLLRAKACAVIAPESSEIEPEWIDRLVRPIYRDHADLVTPVYRRHRFEGILVTNLMYPMTRALYGKPIREPRPAEFAMSDRLAGQFVGHELWASEAGRLGPDVCFTMTALAEGLAVFQTFLGPKGHLERPSTDLVAALRQTVAPLFWSMERSQQSWVTIHETQALPATGPAYDVTIDEVAVDHSRLLQMFRSGVADLQTVLKSILSARTLEQLQHAAAVNDSAFGYSGELWATTVYEFASAYHRSVISRDHIIQALAPLYRGRAYTFLAENLNASEADLEASIETLCVTFERLKPYLIELWTAEERGS
jgi:glucosylglycerate synthase